MKKYFIFERSNAKVKNKNKYVKSKQSIKFVIKTHIIATKRIHVKLPNFWKQIVWLPTFEWASVFVRSIDFSRINKPKVWGVCCHLCIQYGPYHELQRITQWAFQKIKATDLIVFPDVIHSLNIIGGYSQYLKTNYKVLERSRSQTNWNACQINWKRALNKLNRLLNK